MSGRALGWVDGLSLPAGHAHVLQTLAEYHQLKLGCFPSIASIVRRTKLSRETVKRRLKDIVGLGLISKTTKYRDGRRATTYTLHFDVTIQAPKSMKAFRAWCREEQHKKADYEALLAGAVSRKDRVRVMMSRATFLTDVSAR
jgi:DNA-binding MarR family transcriptional regulator